MTATRVDDDSIDCATGVNAFERDHWDRIKRIIGPSDQQIIGSSDQQTVGSSDQQTIGSSDLRII